MPRGEGHENPASSLLTATWTRWSVASVGEFNWFLHSGEGLLSSQRLSSFLQWFICEDISEDRGVSYRFSAWFPSCWGSPSSFVSSLPFYRTVLGIFQEVHKVWQQTTDWHELYLFCLGEAHCTDFCVHRQEFSSQTQKKRAARLCTALMELALLATPPSASTTPFTSVSTPATSTLKVASLAPAALVSYDPKVLTPNARDHSSHTLPLHLRKRGKRSLVTSWVLLLTAFIIFVAELHYVYIFYLM